MAYLESRSCFSQTYSGILNLFVNTIIIMYTVILLPKNLKTTHFLRCFRRIFEKINFLLENKYVLYLKIFCIDIFNSQNKNQSNFNLFC